MKDEINIVKYEDISYLKERFVYGTTVYEEKLNSILFKSHELKMEEFIQKIENHYLLSRDEAILVSRFLFERRNKPKVVFDKDTVRRSNFIIRRFKEFIGKYTKIETEDLEDLKFDFEYIEDNEVKREFIKKFEALSHWEYSTPVDVMMICNSLKIKIDVSLINAYYEININKVS